MHQLERAIELFLNERDFICALTLAGAADGILGEMLQASGKRASLDDHVVHIQSEEPSAGTPKSLRDKHFNLAKHLLKHHKVSPQTEVSLALETEAIYMVTRAVDNSVRMGHELIGHRAAFVSWVYAYRPDLVGA